MKASFLAIATTALAFAVAGCAASPPPVGRLKLVGTPGDARVVVDDRDAADLKTVSRLGLKLRRGKHRVTVERAGYFPWDREVDVTSDEPMVLEVNLTKIPE